MIVGIVCTKWLCVPTKWFCVIFHIGETLINTGPRQFVPLVIRSGYGYCVYVVVLSDHVVVLGDIIFRGNPY